MVRNRSRKGREFTSPEEFKPFRDRRVRVTVVECPTCLAAAGDPCQSASGNLVHHRARRALAIRTERGDAA